MKRTRRILFVHGSRSTFSNADLELFQHLATVRELLFKRKGLDIMRSIGASARGAYWADTVISWFGASHALVPSLVGRLLGRRVILISCGYDCARVPEVDYGNMRPGYRRLLGKLIFALAHEVWAASEAARHDQVANVGVPSSKIWVIPLAVPVPAASLQPRKRAALCVGFVDVGNVRRKGLDCFVQAAALIPDCEFWVAGRDMDGSVATLRSRASPNVHFLGYVDDMRDLMARASVIVQVSAHEGFGLAVAEAMAAGCLPVTSDRGSLPELVGDCGFIVPFNNPQATADAIRQALCATDEDRSRARSRILDQFPPERRRRSIAARLGLEGVD